MTGRNPNVTPTDGDTFVPRYPSTRDEQHRHALPKARNLYRCPCVGQVICSNPNGCCLPPSPVLLTLLPKVQCPHLFAPPICLRGVSVNTSPAIDSSLVTLLQSRITATLSTQPPLRFGILRLGIAVVKVEDVCQKIDDES